MIRLIFGSVLAGVIAGRLGLAPEALRPHLETLITWGVYVVVFAVGVGIGRNRTVWLKVRALGLRALLLPAGVAAGTLLGALAGAFVLHMAARDALAVGAGFGWYSLSGVLLTKLRGAELGAVAFLANVFRELMAVAAMPLLARRFGVFTVIAPGGATTMDTTLPLIARLTGPHGAVLALVNGIALSFLVPVLVPFLAR